MKSRVATLALLTLAGCEFFVQGQLAQIPSGTQTSDGGSGSDGGRPRGDAGLDAGLTADGGCPGSGNLYALVCAPMMNLALSGATFSHPTAAAVGGDFVIAFQQDLGIEVVTLSPGGSVLSRTNYPLGVSPTALQLASRAGRWALVWNDPNAKRLGCATSGSDAGWIDLSATAIAGPSSSVGVAVDDNGGVGLTTVARDPVSLRSGNYYVGFSASGCPTGVIQFDSPQDVWSSELIAVTGTTVDPFRALTSHSNQPGMTIPTYFWWGAVLPDGGYGFGGSGYDYLGTNGFDQFDADAVLSSDGMTVLFTYAFERDAGSYELDQLAVQSSGLLSSNPVTLAGFAAGAFQTQTCGQGCAATAYTGAGPTGAVSVAFTNDALNAQVLGSWDVACDQPLADSGVAVAAIGNTIAVPFTTPNGAQVLLCSRPF